MFPDPRFSPSTDPRVASPYRSDRRGGEVGSEGEDAELRGRGVDHEHRTWRWPTDARDRVRRVDELPRVHDPYPGGGPVRERAIRWAAEGEMGLAPERETGKEREGYGSGPDP